jgi:flagellar biosynthesis protein FlhB
MLFDKIYYKKNHQERRKDDNFIFHYVMKWLIIILIVSLFFMIVNNIFYNTLEHEINSNIYNYPVTPSDMIKVDSGNLKPTNDIITIKSVNDILENTIVDQPMETFKELSTNIKSLNTLPKVEYSSGDPKLFENLKNLFKSMDTIPVNDQIDFSLNL